MDFNGQFWGLKLSGQTKKTFTVPERTILLITGVCVDVDAPENKRAVLTLNYEGKEHTLASLNPGVAENVSLDIPLYGTVCLQNKGARETGIHVLGRYVAADDMEADDEKPNKKTERSCNRWCR
uniref:Nucleoplasmin-like domain-containing protein n=1 Tax=Aplanochytrium stocchinoi TaxID=215587 RepID=A0A7S3PJD4_9STRA